ncbi:MAG: hypothetical protein GX776_05155 [Oxalobacter sp.]|nr:hypothetical protein [Oxalobacter sp.]
MRRLLVPALVLLLGGCVSYQGLPSGWEAIEKHDTTDDCASIAGMYANQGEYPDGSPVYLTTLLIPEKSRKGAFTTGVLEKADTITLTRDKGTAFLMRMKGEGLDAQKKIDRSRGHYRCVEGVMQMDDTHGSQDGVIARSHFTFRTLYRTDDWLTIKSTGMDTTLLVVIPLNQYEYRWARFAVKKPEAIPAPEENAP